MSQFVVRFMKGILGENGQDAEICRSSMEIDASNKIDAAEMAKKRFCVTEDVTDWSLHADWIEVKESVLPVLSLERPRLNRTMRQSISRQKTNRR